MANVVAVKEETNLAGVLKSQLTATGLSFTALFYDTKTGVQRTPQSTTLTFTINKDGAKAERIRLTSHTTDATTGITTCTIASSGRALPKYGVGSGSSTGFQHEPGDPIGCVTNHEPTAQLISWMEGSVGSGARSIRVGDETDNDIYFYAQNADGSKPYLAYLSASNAWAFSNDGSSSTLIGNGASVYTAGDGISLTGSDFDIDLTDTTIFKSSSAGAGDSGKVPRLNGSGELDGSFIPQQTLADAVSDLTVTAAQINSIVGAFQISYTALEAIDGSSTPQYVAYGSSSMKDRIMIYHTGNEFGTGTGSNNNIGNADSSTRQAQGFTYTDSLAEAITLSDVTLIVCKVGTPTDNLYVELYSSSGGLPSTLVANGTTTTVAGGSLVNPNYETVKFTWNTPPSITSGAMYHLVLRRSGANDAANYYRVLDAAGNQYANGTPSTYTASTTTWSAGTNDLQMQLVLNVSYGGKIVKCDADNVLRSNGIGFVTSSINAAASGDVYYDRHIDYTGLTAGTTYASSTTAGSVTADSSLSMSTSIDTPTGYHVAGVAMTSSKLKIGSYKRRVVIDDKIGAIMANTVSTTNRTFDLLVPVGFRPDEIIIRYHYDDSSAGDYSGHSVETRYMGITEVGGTFIYDTVSAGRITDSGVNGGFLDYGNITDSPIAGAVTLTEIYDNAVRVRLTLDDSADSLDLASMEFIKY